MQEQDNHHSDNKNTPIWTDGPAKQSYDQLLATLGNNSGFTILTGESGCGKTVLANWFFDELDSNIVRLIVSSRDLSEGNFFQTIAHGYGLRGSFNTRMAFTLNFSAFLYKCQHAGKKVVLLIDDCQNLNQHLFDIIRHIGKIERDNQKLIQLFLFAQPPFLDVIENTANSTFKTSCSNFYILKNFNRQESARYISHCLNQIGCTDNLFCLNGLELIHRASGGIVEKINNLCEKTLTDLPDSGSVPMSKIYSAIDSLGFTAYDEPVQDLPKAIIQERIMTEKLQEDLLIGISEKAGLIKPSDDVTTTSEQQQDKPVDPDTTSSNKKSSKKVAIIILAITAICVAGFYGVQRFKQMATDTVNSDILAVNSDILAVKTDKQVDTEIEPIDTIFTPDVAIEPTGAKSVTVPAEVTLVKETVSETPLVVTKVRSNDQAIEPPKVAQNITQKPSPSKKVIESVEVALMNAQKKAPVPVKKFKLPMENKIFIVPLHAGNEYIITLNGRREMNKFSAAAAEFSDAKITVKGYVSSDNDSPENLNISIERAKKMAKRLVENGLNKDRLDVIGMGIQNPITSNQSQAGRNKNRRVELEVTTENYIAQ